MVTLSSSDVSTEDVAQKAIQIQLRLIELAKWFEGERIHRDPGEDYVIQWISEKAEWFRRAWNESTCKKCKKVNMCGVNLKKVCNENDVDI